jgi:hypothetical protein
MESGNLNLLEHSGPHRTCYGNPLPFLPIIFTSEPILRQLKLLLRLYASQLFAQRMVKKKDKNMAMRQELIILY